MGRVKIDLDLGILTEREILILKKRLSDGKMELSDFPDWMWDRGFRLTSEQSQKGLDWLINQWKTPTGRERKNNPFGWREMEALENFEEFRLVGFYDTATYTAQNYDIHFYMPIYRVVGSKTGFEYYVSGGKSHIIG